MSSQRKIINIACAQSFFGHHLVDLSDIKPGFRLLDVGTGDGACLIPAAKKTGEHGKAIGIDYNDRAVKSANEKLEKCGIPNAAAYKMDARQMSYPDSDFDYALCGFVGFGSIYDYEKKEYRPNKSNKIMEEIHRVLKLGGGAGFSNWRNQECLETLRELTVKYLEESGKSPLRSIGTGYSKEDEEGIKRLMTDAGFTDICIHVEDIDVIYKDDDEWFYYMRRSGRNIIYNAVGEDYSAHKQLKKAILPLLDSHRRDNTLVFTKSVIYSYGTKTTDSPHKVDGKQTIVLTLASEDHR